MAFRFIDFDAIGFDVDHAFIQYKLENLFPIVYESLARVLIKTKGYPKELLEEPFKNYADFCTRGLVLDADKGDIVKVSKDGKVIRASHGTKMMDEATLTKKYGKDRTWSPFENFVAEMKTKGNFLRGASYRMFENFFDMPAMLLCARLIDIIDKEEGGKEKYKLMWPDVLSSLIVNFDYCSFEADIHKFIKPCSQKLKDWLKKLRNEGKKLFLLTNSRADFSMFVLENAFGRDWRSYFDVTISRAQKPGFFRDKKDFVEVVDSIEGKDPVDTLKADKYYAQGNSAELEEYLSKICKKAKAKVLFCGDSFISDIYPSSYFSNWDTVALLEELEVETMNTEVSQNHQENGVHKEPLSKRPKIDEENSVQDSDTHTTPKALLMSSTWGSIFGENGELMNTLFSGFIAQYSSLVIPGLDSITDLPLDYSFKENAVGQTRFFPKAPQIPCNKRNELVT